MKKNIRYVSPAIPLLLSAFVLLGITVASAQNVRRNLAVTYFSQHDFYQAAPIYNELAKLTLKGGKKGKAVDWESVRKAAQANMYVRNYASTARWYGEMAKAGRATREDFAMYFEALRYMGNYAEADRCMDSLEKMDSRHPIVKTYARKRNYPTRLRKDSSDFEIQKLKFNRGQGSFGPAYHEDGLVFASSRAGSTAPYARYGRDNTYFLDVFYVRKKKDGFGKTTKLQRGTLETEPHDGPIFFSPDNRQAFITRNRVKKDTERGERIVLGLYISEKEKNKWGTPQPFPYNSTSYSVGHAALSPDGHTLYFASDMPGGHGGVDIWKCDRLGAGWAEPVNLGPHINSPYDDMFPFVAGNGSLIFASKGHVGLGGFDLFEARKGGQGFMVPVNIGYPLNTQYDDFALIGDSELKNGYFSSDRGDYVDRIYGVRMNRILLTLEGLVTEHADSGVRPLAGVDVNLVNTDAGDTLVLKTDSDGRFYAPLEKESDYVVLADKYGYGSGKQTVLSTKGAGSSKTYPLELVLTAKEPFIDNETGTDLRLLVLDERTGKPLRNTEIIVKNTKTGKEQTIRTDSEGIINLGKGGNIFPTTYKLRIANTELPVEAIEEGYVPKEKEVIFALEGNEGNKLIRTVSVERIHTDDKFILKYIYYDYNEALLSPKSKVQLDKLYTFLQHNTSMKVELSSHTDSRGSDDYNLALSQRRAQSCVDYLIHEKGVSPSRIVAKGYGETKPLNGCVNGVPCTEKEYQENRRTEIRILQME